MFIRIEFENLESEPTQKTRSLFFGIPNGMFLSSYKASAIAPKVVRDAVGYSVVFWYLDVDVLDKNYGGVKKCLNQLLSYAGVKRVDILPIDRDYDSFVDKWDEFDATLMKYVYAV